MNNYFEEAIEARDLGAFCFGGFVFFFLQENFSIYKCIFLCLV